MSKVHGENERDRSGGAGMSGSAGPDPDDPQGMRGQLDDSMDGLESDDDLGQASRGIPQNAETESDDGGAT